MKIKVALITLVFSTSLLCACSGDKSTRTSKDTGDRYGVKPDDTSKVDTSKIASPDNSASGGSKIDTTKKPK